jgi:hypothetical protein
VALAALAGGLAYANTGPCTYMVKAGAATDSLTGLTWETDPTDATYTPGNAATHCNGLMLDGNGPGVWRVPTLRELQTIVHEGNANPAIDTNTFTIGSDPICWSSTPVAAAPGNLWGVQFTDGAVLTYGTTDMHAVRCVH